MKKLILIIVLVFFVQFLRAQSWVSLSATNKGIAPIPAFNLPKPAVFAFTNFKFGKYLSFCPDFAFDASTGRAWFADNWVRVELPLDSAGKLTATLGFDWSIYFQPFKVSGVETITQSVIYPTYQGKISFVPNPENSLVFDWWKTHPIRTENKYGVRGDYFSLKYTRTKDLKKVSINGGVNTFYIKYSDGSNGFAVTYDAAITHKKSGIFLGPQFLHSLSPKEKTFVKPNGNITIGITRTIKH